MTRCVHLFGCLGLLGVGGDVLDALADVRREKNEASYCCCTYDKFGNNDTLPTFFKVASKKLQLQRPRLSKRGKKHQIVDVPWLPIGANSCSPCTHVRRDVTRHLLPCQLLQALRRHSLVGKERRRAARRVLTKSDDPCRGVLACLIVVACMGR